LSAAERSADPSLYSGWKKNSALMERRFISIYNPPPYPLRGTVLSIISKMDLVVCSFGGVCLREAATA